MTAFELAAKITLDSSEFSSSLDKSEKDAKSWGNKISAWTVAKGQLIADFAKKAVTSTADIFKNVMKESIGAYKEFEQLEGGTRLLYGNNGKSLQKYLSDVGITAKSTKKEIESATATWTKNEMAQEKVLQRAKEAYRTVQMSQNDYLQQANSYATGLKKYLGGDADAAADLADKIITAQADVVAATGASQESVSNAFAGIMKGNYTMLDNLQLGITPTKKGMQDLIKEVNKWNKENGKATKYNINNLADQQAALVDYIEMQGLAGYAGKEASDTIEGSMASTKAAWENLLVALGSGKDVKDATKNLAKSIKKLAKNMIPVFKNVISGIGDFIKEAIPQIGEFFDKTIKKLKESDSPVLQKLGGALEGIKKVAVTIYDLFTDFPGTIERLKSSDSPILNTLAGALEGIKSVAETVYGLFTDFPSTIERLKSSDSPVLNLLAQAFEGIKSAAETVYGLFTDFPGTIEKLKSSDSPILNTLADALDTLKTIAEAIITAFTDGIPAGIEKLKEADDPLTNLLAGGLQLLYDVCKFFMDNLGLEGVITGIAGAFALFKGIKIASSFLSFLDKIKSLGGSKNLDAVLKALSGAGYSGSPTPPNPSTPTPSVPTPSTPTPSTPSVDAGGKTSFVRSLFGKAGSFLGNVGGVAAVAAPFALFIDALVHDQQLMKQSYEKGEKALEERKQFQEEVINKNEDNGLGEIWDVFAGKTTAGWDGDSEAKMKEFASRFSSWWDDDASDPVLDKFSDLFNDEEWEDVLSVMDKYKQDRELEEQGYKNADSGMYSDEEIEQFNNALQMMREKIEQYATGGEEDETEEEYKEKVEELGAQTSDTSESVEDLGDHSETAGKKIIKLDKSAVSASTSLGSLGSSSAYAVESVDRLVDVFDEKAEELANLHFGSDGDDDGEDPGHAKGLWDVPYDNYKARLHRDEMVLTASQARDYKDKESSDASAVVGAIQSLKNELANLKLVVGQKTFGRAVVDYGGRRMSRYIGSADSRAAAGFGT